jgi:cell division protein FtsW
MRKTISLFIAIVLILTTLGIVILASASSDEFGFVWRQLIWLTLSFCTACVAARIDYRFYKKIAVPLALFSLLLLVLVRIPGIGHEIKGSWRWLRLGPLTIQPSEISKVAVIVLFSWWLSRNQRRIDELKRGIVIPFGMLACFAVLLIVEPDFGTTMLVSSVAVFMMFLGGVSIAPLLVTGLCGFMGVIFLIFQNPERMSRILAFLDPQKYAQGKGWQLINSLRAFCIGGMDRWYWGTGLGGSEQKKNYLPEAHTDFIFPIIGEELGLVVALIVVMMYLILFVLGVKIALNARDDFGRFLAIGITLMITMQALINFAVVTGCVPTKGLALPFISYGGSSLVISGVMVGILVNVAHAGMHAPSAASRKLFKDRARRV